ncbi:MAG: NAD(P)H-dependent oxidoreductase [Oscillospiraceae bacterium]|nr:NAD(P)H-dependent oxidoreductase [Oscillospiraceae bacterium]
MSKVLVAYFSATGNTAKVAQELARLEKADLFEIKPQQPYTPEDLNFNVKDCRANLEMADESSRPAMVGKVENLEQYDVVFVGTPIWWGREAAIIDTFLDSHSFAGKTIIPFCTSGISDVDKASAHIKGIVGDGVTVDAGKRLGADGSEEEVRIWTELLGL